ncbi:deoxyribonuclease I, partial [Planococcus sp. SIMBA_143]
KLEGTLGDQEVFVLANSNSNEKILAQADSTNNSVINFNGNDVLVLKKNGSVIDSFGQIGNDTSFASDVTLVRKDSVKSGDTDATDA